MKGGNDNQPVGGGEEPVVQDHPVSEELLERAREDEDDKKKVAELEARVAQLESELAAAHEALDASERRREIEQRLGEADAIDVETARLLTEAAVESMDAPDVALAVEDLRRRKPFLFAGGNGSVASARSATALSPAGAFTGETGREALRELAEDARASGDRRALLQYLRKRRGVC
ncbi:MAG: hypothetical protein R3B57_06995 [Phycisphaerales bacterium]